MNDSIGFALRRVESGASVEMRDTAGKILVCGAVETYRLSGASVHVKTRHDLDTFVDCPTARTATEADVKLSDVGYIEIVTPRSEYYVYRDGWRNTAWSKPIKKGAPAFRENSKESFTWRRYTRPPKAIPGVFWPELRLMSGGYLMTRTFDHGVPVGLALDFKMHRNLYPLSLIIETGYFMRVKNGKEDAVSPYRFATGSLGIGYAFLMFRQFSLAAIISGGVIGYFFNDERVDTGGIRPFVSTGVLLAVHVLKNNRDFHKVSLVFQPSLGMILNQTESDWRNFPLLVEFKLGVQYAY